MRAFRHRSSWTSSGRRAWDVQPRVSEGCTPPLQSAMVHEPETIPILKLTPHYCLLNCELMWLNPSMTNTHTSNTATPSSVPVPFRACSSSCSSSWLSRTWLRALARNPVLRVMLIIVVAVDVEKVVVSTGWLGLRVGDAGYHVVRLVPKWMFQRCAAMRCGAL